MPRYEIEYEIKGTLEIDAPNKSYAHDIFHDKNNADFADSGDVHIVAMEEVSDYKE